MRAATPSWSAQTLVAMDCLAPLSFGDTASRSTLGKTANLKLQQDVRFPFTQLMKTRSKMVEDTKDTYFCISLFFPPVFFFYHQIFTLKHSLGRKRGLKRCSVPSVHMGVHMLQLSEKGVGCLGQLIASPRVSCTAPRSKPPPSPPLPAPPSPSPPPSSLPGPTVVKQYHGGRLTTL